MKLRKLVFRILYAMVLLCAAGLLTCGTEKAVHKAAGNDTTGQVNETDIQNSDTPVSSAEGSPQDDTVIITGMVHIYGNEPHTFAGIECEDGKIYAVYPREKEAEISALQGRLIEFTVRFMEKPAGEGSLYLRDGTVTPISWRVLTP
jgi:hypothetical protein